MAAKKSAILSYHRAFEGEEAAASRKPVIARLFVPLAALFLACQSVICTADTDKARGQFVTHPAFHSKYLKADRDIRVWLPPGYDTDKSRRYPVFYLHDGQNLYKGGPSFIPNQAWNADTTAEELIDAGRIRPLILVGIDNAGRERMNEYTPSEIARFPGSGKGDLYGKMIVEDIGTKEGEAAVEPARKLRAALIAKGWKVGGDLRYLEAEGAGHNERAWAARFPEVLIYLFGK